MSKRGVQKTQEELAVLHRKMEEAAECLKEYYKPGSELIEMTEALAGDDFYEYTDEDIKRMKLISARLGKKSSNKAE